MLFEENEIEINTAIDLPSYNHDYEELNQSPVLSPVLNQKNITTYCLSDWTVDGVSEVQFKNCKIVVKGKNKILKKFKQRSIKGEDGILQIIRKIKKLTLK